MSAAAPMLIAVAERLAEDIDGAEAVRDRVSAVRALLDVVAALDAVPAAPGPQQPGSATAGGADDDNPFGIPDVPPAVGDPPQS